MMTKVRIAVCDDERGAADLIAGAVESIFKKKEVDTEITVYSSSSQLLWDIDIKAFNLLFLDIDMPDLDGVELGKKLRSEGNRVDIIFVSNREDRVFDTMKIAPVCFVRKSHILTDIPEAVELYLDKQRSVDKKIVIKSKDQIITVKVSGVMYIEGDRNQQTIHFEGNDLPLKIRSTMQELEDDFVPLGFIRIHKGYIVNADYISIIDGNDILLKNRMRLPVSRRKLQEVKDKYLLIMKDKNQIVL